MAKSASKRRAARTLKLVGWGSAVTGLYWLWRRQTQREAAQLPIKAPAPVIEIVEAQKPYASAPRAEKADSYWVNSAFLAECWLWLMQASPDGNSPNRMRTSAVAVGVGPEWAFLVTGVRASGVRLMTERVPARFAHQSVARVAFELSDFHRALLGMQRWGYSLHAVFHSHRFRGPVSPSAIDLETQKRILEPTYPAIQAVFSEDGYIRFFSLNRPFSVDVFGEGVDHVDQNLYRLKEELIEAAAAGAFWSPLVFPS